MENKWKEIWEKRTDRFDEIDMTDPKAVFLELKRIDGFDVVEGGMSYDALLKQNNDIIKSLSKYGEINTIFDVGCGCGANLYLFQNDGMSIGGMDYSSALIEIAIRLFKKYDTNIFQPLELVCAEAINLPIDLKYDSVVANSVFSYFKDEIYAENVLNRMLQKSKKSIGLIDLHDIEKKDAFEEYRRKTVKDYDVRYKDLHKLFYRREFFYDWALKNNLEIEFQGSQVEGYWNNEFVFDVYMYKKYQ